MSHFCKTAMTFGSRSQFRASVFRAEFRATPPFVATRKCSANPEMDASIDTCSDRARASHPRRPRSVRGLRVVPRASFLFLEPVRDPGESAFFAGSHALQPVRAADEASLAWRIAAAHFATRDPRYLGRRAPP